MTPAIHNNEWTDAQLEAYHDSELSGDELAALAEALRTNPALRERLAGIARCDAIARAALATEPAARTLSTSGAAWRFRASAFAVAAALAVVVTASIIVQNMRSAPSVVTGIDPQPPRTAHAEPELRPDGVVLSLVLNRKTAEEKPLRGPREPAIAPPSNDVQLDRALAAGDIEAATALLRDASPAQRALATERLGRIVRTGKLAEQILQSLPLDDQLELCEAWASQPHLRYASFSHLSDLAASPASRDAVAITVEQLRAKPGMTGWLRSYGLVEPNT